MATTKITSPELFDLGSLNTALQLPSGTTAERPTSPSTGEWRYNTDNNLIEFYDGGDWRELQDEDIPPVPSEHFNVVTWTGNGTSQSITGVGFQPDWVWCKERSNTSSNELIDSSRGATKFISSNNTNAEATNGQALNQFDSDGFTVGNDGAWNQSGETYVAWCWKANGGTTTSNTEGTRSSTVQANTKSGFSIVEWTGDGNTATIGHGLSAAPELIIVKTKTAVSDWPVYSSGLTSAAYRLVLNSTAAESTTNDEWNSTAPTSTVFSVGSGGNVSGSGQDFVGYCFHSVAGYSKISTYTGNGSTNGPIVNTGFEPAFIMIKNASAIYEWTIYDNKRSTFNPRDNVLYPNTNGAENSGETGDIDFLSNGFQIKATDGSINQNGGNIIYMAFASDPSTAPVLADSFNTTLYTGNGGSQSITGLGFSPNWVWIKSRSNTYGHRLIDTVTGPDKYLETNSTSMQQGAGGAGLTSFDSDGFSVGSGNAHNANGATFVAWNWKANPIPTIITDGGVQSVVSANTEAGFSIVKYEGNGSTQNIPHGLSAAPEFIIIKNLDSSTNWVVGSDEIAWNYSLNLNDSTAKGLSTNRFNSTAPTASVFSVGNTSVSNGSGVNYIAYCFHSVSGFSKISSYTGTGTGVSQSITGLGFSPNWVMIKETDGVDSWQVYDTDRGAGKVLYPNGNNAEYAGSELSSFDSDGFTVTGNPNESGKTYLYMAFKENPSPIVPAGQMAFLTVAGGGGGGTGYLYSYPAGGGGAGGLRTSFGTTSGGGSSAEPNTTLYSGTYTITVGAGAPGLSYNNYTQQQGGVSSIAHSSITTIESTGGGTGGTNGGNAGGQAGGSGGGSKGGSGGSGAGTANQGFGGGTFPGGSEEGGQGGGGASAAGSAGQTYNGGAGGNGLEVSITGSAVTYAGGGGGGGSRSFGGGGAGGSGGGGAATGNGSCCGNPGTANTGGAGAGGGGGSGRTGHGGTGYFAGGAGGSGIVVLRLQTAEYSGTTTGSPTVTTVGDETILTYTGSGTYVHS